MTTLPVLRNLGLLLLMAAWVVAAHVGSTGWGNADVNAVVAVLPGSRPGELRHIAPVFLQAVALLHRRRPQLRFVLPVAAGHSVNSRKL